MIQFTGNNYLKLPEANPIAFVFNTISVNTTGVSTIAFTNVSGVTGFSFLLSGQNIYLKSTAINKCISSYNTGQSFSLSGTYISGTNNSYLDFYVRDLHINSWQESLPSNLYHLHVNVASGDTMTIDSQMYCNPIIFNLNLPSSYVVNTTFTGSISTNTKFWVLGSTTTFLQSYQTLLGIDPIIASVSATTPLTLTIPDLDDSSQDYEITAQSYWTTDIGTQIVQAETNRMGNEENILNNFELLSTQTNISGLFDGIWSGETFIYSDFPEYATYNFQYDSMNTSGIYLTNQSVLIQLQPSSPTNGQTYKSEYITGFILTNSGNYQSPPAVVFNNYYYATGLTQSWNTLMFSSGCSGNIPFYATGGGGTGASGYLLTLPISLTNLYVSGNALYNLITGVNMVNIGTNYTGSPNIIVQTGVYGNCYDVPVHYGYNIYYFNPLNTSGALSPQATFLTGIVLTTTGVSGNYYVTGLEVTNIGYGYNASRTPYCAFLRQSGDTFTGNASGTFQLKATGLYNINNYWTIYTGWSNNTLSPLISGLSGVLYNTQRFFSVVLQCSGLDNTSGIVSQLSLLPLQGTGLSYFITGTKYYSGDPYFLKKKLNPELLLVPISGDLSFLTTQSDLDSVYSNYTSNQGLNIGDLDF